MEWNSHPVTSVTDDDRGQPSDVLLISFGPPLFLESVVANQLHPQKAGTGLTGQQSLKV